MQYEINLNPLNYFNLTSELIFFVSAKNLTEKFIAFKAELCKAEYITVCRVKDGQDQKRKYTFLTPNYMFEAFLSEKNNFSLSMNGVFSDKEALSRKKFNYYQKSVFIIKTNKKTAVINYADKTKYTAFGEDRKSVV